jgi:hypothetical protein
LAAAAEARARAKSNVVLDAFKDDVDDDVVVAESDDVDCKPRSCTNP